MRLSLILAALCSTLIAKAEVPKYGFTKAENKMMAEANAQTAYFENQFPSLFSTDNPLSLQLLSTTTASAFAEYQETGYLIFSSNYAFSSRNAKLTMAKHLPEGVQLVVFTGSNSSNEATRIKKEFSEVLDESRITVVYMPGASRGFWARDSVPVPVFRRAAAENAVEVFTVVDARYSRFEQDARFSNLFQAEMTQYNYYYEGGNFIANAKNECLIVNKTATAKMPDSIFKDHYGCKVLTRLPHVKGIGHADESVKFIDDKTVLTDEVSYIPLLEDRGYKVIQLPRPNRHYETYVNSLLINGTIYVPIFDEEGDEQALQIYRDLGFDKVIGINTQVLSNQGLGSLHCITMGYPPVEMSELLNSMGGAILE